MAKYEAFPVFVGYPASTQPATWNVVMRSMDGSVAASAKILATFHGGEAERDAKCHAAKLNERESGPESPFVDPEFEVKERLVEEGEKFVAAMAEPVRKEFGMGGSM